MIPLVLLAVAAVAWGDAPYATRRILAAQIAQESAWRTDAVSPVGAEGLAQFMPATWAEEAAHVDCGEKPATDPACALAAQQHYVRKAGRWAKAHTAASPRARIAMALSAYNGGAGWVVREAAKCQQLDGCNPRRWRGHVERVCLRSEAACRENKAYPSVILARLE